MSSLLPTERTPSRITMEVIQLELSKEFLELK